MNNFDDILDNIPSESQNAQLSKEEYAAKKKAEREAVFALSDDTTAEAANDGGRFWQYLDVQSNKEIAEDRPADFTGELILKILNAPIRKVRVRDEAR